MSGLLEASIMVFFIGVLSIWYGTKVQNPWISTVMGFITIITVVVLIVISLVAVLT